MESVNVEFINPFVTGALSVLSMVLGEVPEQGHFSAEAVGSTSAQINVVIGITGQAQGHIILGMSLITADKIASKMIGQPVVTFDAMAASAISELGNMICGNALSNLAGSGHVCDLTPPTVVKGEQVQISNVEVPSIVMPLTLSQGAVNITMALRGKTNQVAA